MNDYIKKYLYENIDLKYKEFSKSLLPSDTNILGVRLPLLRKLAKEISLGDYSWYLENASDDTFEEIMLQGMVIGNLKTSFEVITNYIDKFIPKINNWSVCDSFVSSLKITKKYKKEMFEYIRKYSFSSEYGTRFMLVMFTNYYVDIDYLPSIFNIINSFEIKDYYVKMAVAWLLSICYINYEELTIKYLKKCKLDAFTYNKALQKITESKRVSLDKKKEISNMKR